MKPSTYLKNLDITKWTVICENNTFVGVKSLTDNCEIIIAPNDNEQATLIMKKNSVVIVSTSRQLNNPNVVVNIMWDHSEMVSRSHNLKIPDNDNK